MSNDLIARLEAAEGALRWLGVHIPKRGVSRMIWEYLIPSACRENLDDTIAALKAKENSNG